MSSPTSELVPSLVQGISQQAAYSRAKGANEDQENCINDLLRGARARNGGAVLAHGSQAFDDPFKYRIKRSPLEDYVFTLEGGQVRIFNLADGTQCSVTTDTEVTDSGYLGNTGSSRRSFSAVTVKDTTFLANKQVVPAMAAEVSPARGHLGIVHFKASTYSTLYKVTVRQGASSWTASYTTPDNSVAVNATFIATNRLASEFGQALDAVLPAAFSVFWRGSSVLIEHDSADFTLESEDGQGGEQLRCFTDKVKRTSDLPESAWDGYTVAVGGDPDKTQSEDFYIEYRGDGDTGAWEEVVRWATPTTLDPDTMPVRIVHTALNTFEIKQATWGKRLAGDGVDTSKDPSFVGSSIVSMEFNEGRLCLFTEDGYVLSRTKNGFVYFPDSAQTNLDTDPVDAENASGSVTTITSSVIAGEQLQAWADEVQTRIDAGDQRLTEEFIANRQVTNYSYDGEVKPINGGQSSIFFGTSRGDHVWFTEVVYRGNVPRGEIEFNSQCSELLPGHLRHLEIASSSSMLVALSSGSDSTAYLYQWYNQGDERVQSAWNKWTWPAVTKIVGAWARQTSIVVLLRWPNGSFTLEDIPSSWRMDTSGLCPIRLDHQVSDLQGTAEAQNADGRWPVLVTLPYEVDTADRANWRAVTSRTTGPEARGVALPVEWVSATQVRVLGPQENHQFLFGRRIRAMLELTELYISRDGLTLPSDVIQIQRVIIHHQDTANYILEVGADAAVETFEAPRGDYANNQVALSNGKQEFSIGLRSGEAKLRLVNDSHLPSAWGAMKYIVEVTSEEV
jgi:hypothetical protein